MLASMKPGWWRAIALLAIAALLITLFYVNRPARLSFHLIADPEGILKEVRPLRELVTVRYSIQKVAGLREDKVPVGSESILLIVQAQVLGGVDLGQLRDKDIRMDRERRVEIKLPAAKILHINLDEKNTKVWDRSKTWWTPWIPYDNDLEKKARMQALDSVKQEAIEMGILLDAQINAQNMIRALLHPLGIQHVAFVQTQS
jgi:hypothetical protein